MRVIGDIEALVEAIVERAEEDARALLERARRAAELEREKAEREAEGLLKKAEEEARREAEGILRRSSARNIREAKKKVALERDKMIEEIFREALERAGTVSRDDRYMEALARLLVEGVRVLGEEVEVVLCPRDRSAFFGRWYEIERKVEELTGKQVRLILSEETVSASGGALLRSPDGRKLYDATFEAKMEFLRETLRQEVSRRLFGEEELG